MNKNKSNKLKGIVVALKANFLIVEIDHKNFKDYSFDEFNGKIRLLCIRRSKLNYQGLFIDVGDIVGVESIDYKNKRAVVSDVEPRQSFLKRPAVANVTLVSICISADEPLFDMEQTSRFLLTAECANIEPLIILTKIDLITKNDLILYINKFKSWGYDCIPVSIHNSQGIDSLIERLRKTKLTVLAGPSGVGKTSLINHLIPTVSLPTSSVSKKLKRGTHTTRHVELFAIGNGSLLADTPGFNRPEIVCEPSDFAFLFPEFRTQLSNSQCKFRNCLHRDEPGCVIDKDLERYPFYRENLEEMINSPLPYQAG
ncbi:Predicted GTPases [Prochlorococcus marinus str. NATL1A]|uniref:Small ribosomal subunit biogenesis GTPase RsgA n=1 Tax=Prochlorococcus marinus (strain NATL1A) TaxID=167555 RepID=RSGA_PROM1|nr:ribosome small subunit-dependent GTPase A [Prochlorococcus marinus]A2BZC2.1 RecName: Full=Small ribosomal subunit biogenesis GTPase RsgA [Prochlorococcus marinus str. NATL1A]ABM74582.1 Predicted GTPases [Prochlorococcus marinus str. NATL1A]